MAETVGSQEGDRVSDAPFSPSTEPGEMVARAAQKTEIAQQVSGAALQNRVSEMPLPPGAEPSEVVARAAQKTGIAQQGQTPGA